MTTPLQSPTVITRHAPAIPAERPPRGRVLMYGLWQLRDYLMDRGAPTFIIGVLGGYATVGPGLERLEPTLAKLPPKLIAKYGGMAAARVVLLHDINEMFLRTFLGAVIFLGALFAMNGIVATDRKQGFFRFLFSKPISPSRYYGQAFLIHWAGFLFIATMMSLLYGALVWPILTTSLFIAFVIMYFVYASIAFLLSSAARWDWLSLVTITVASSWAWDRWGANPTGTNLALYLLPPLNRTTEVYTAVAQGTALPWPLLQWFAAYGAICYIAGLVVLRYRRLAIA